ncbi:MAG: MarR family transcriptional regulator, partial [Aureliella sp.]
MKIYLPAWHYRARAIVQRTWGWSPIEEMILLALDRAPDTIEGVAASLGVPVQVAGSTIARLMQFGLVEIRLSPVPQLATSTVGHDFIRWGGALPERTEDREIHISLVLEKVGHSVF